MMKHMIANRNGVHMRPAFITNRIPDRRKGAEDTSATGRRTPR